MSRYTRITVNGERRAEHLVVWENAYGPIPEGCVIHHLNFNGHDNRLENLIMLTHSEHRKLHAAMKKHGIDPTDPEVIHDRKLQRARAKVRYKLHHDEILAQQRVYGALHREAIRAKSKSYYENHKEECLAKCKLYRQQHAEEYAAYMHDYHTKNRAELLIKKKLYNDAHKKERALKERIRCAIKSGKPQEMIESLRKELETVMGGKNT